MNRVLVIFLVSVFAGMACAALSAGVAILKDVRGVAEYRSSATLLSQEVPGATLRPAAEQAAFAAASGLSLSALGQAADYWLRLEPVRDSDLIQIFGGGPDPAQSAALVNACMASFLNHPELDNNGRRYAVVAPAEASAAPYRESLTRSMLRAGFAGGILGFLLALLIAFAATAKRGDA